MTLKVPPIQTGNPIVDSRGCATPAFQRQWDDTIRAIVNSINGTTAAQDAANAAQATATGAAKDTKLLNSYTVPSAVLSASDAGASATITVAPHTRVYGDGSSVVIAAGDVFTGLAYSTAYAVYYDDLTLSTATPSYVLTSAIAAAQFDPVTGRHKVGSINTPASGGSGTTGGGSPPGGGPIP